MIPSEPSRRPPMRIQATHAATALREALIAAQDERWRRQDAQAAKAATPEPAAAPPRRPKPAAKAAPSKPDVPPGHLLLTPPEVKALGHLLDLHPELRS